LIKVTRYRMINGMIPTAMSLIAVEQAAGEIGYDRPTLVVNPKMRPRAESIARKLAFNVRQDMTLNHHEWFVEYKGKRVGSDL
jgi:hypothetical protein